MNRPTNPAYKFKVTIAGQTYTQTESGGLEHMVIEDHVDMIGVARFTFNLDHVSWSSMPIGQEVEVETGSSGRKLFKGVITGMRHGKKRGHETLTVTAMDPLVKAGASRRTKTYEEMTHSQIAEEVIGLAGLEVGQVDSTEETFPYTFQRNESDLEFLKRLASKNNFLVMCREGKVDFCKPQYQGESTEIEDTRVEHLDYSMNAANIPPSLTTTGWDYVATEKVEGSAESGDLVTIGSGQPATEVASQIWSGDPSFITDMQVRTQGDAKSVASAELNRMARSFLRGTATVDGNSDVFAGSKIRFKGYRQGFNAEVYVVSTKHVFEFKKGYSTEVTFCSNTMPT
jgi:phage protein D